MLKIYTDGGARGNPGPSACAFVVVKDGKVIFSDSKFLGKTTNNVAEYNAVKLAYEWLVLNKGKIKNETIVFFLDSELLVKQLNGVYKIRNKNLAQIALKIRRLQDLLNRLVFYKHVPREKNLLADFLVNKEIDKHLI